MGRRRHYLTKKQMKELREILEKQLNDLVGKNQDILTGMTQKEIEVHPDNLDQATDESNRMLELRIHDREQKLVAKIRKTIEKMDNEEYGYCKSCGEPIGFERLKARPVADLCIECKLEFEARERRERDMSQLSGIKHK